jgi:hypothetical protein
MSEVFAPILEKTRGSQNANIVVLSRIPRVDVNKQSIVIDNNSIIEAIHFLPFIEPDAVQRILKRPSDLTQSTINKTDTSWKFWNLLGEVNCVPQQLTI